jgi:hypothetical protein
VATLVSITGPIAAGKNTTADCLAERAGSAGMSVVVADVDDVAHMVAGPGAGASGLWFAAHVAHGALVAAWMGSEVDLVIAVGPIYSEEEQRALFEHIPGEARIVKVLVDAPVAVTWARVSSEPGRGMSRQRDFHMQMHERFRTLRPGIPADLVFDSAHLSAVAISSAIFDAVTGTTEPAG